MISKFFLRPSLAYIISEPIGGFFSSFSSWMPRYFELKQYFPIFANFYLCLTVYTELSKSKLVHRLSFFFRPPPPPPVRLWQRLVLNALH